MEGHWGFNKVEKYNEEYFLESSRDLEPLCPFSKPKMPCPHTTTGEPFKGFWVDNPGIYLDENKELLIDFDMRKLAVNMFRTYYFYNGIETARKIIKDKVMEDTNYIPIFVLDFKIDGKQNKFLELLLPEVNKIGRSIVLFTRGVKVPVPGFVKRITKEDLK